MSNAIIEVAEMADSDFTKMMGVYKFFSRLVGVLPFEGRNFNFIGTRFITATMLISTYIAFTMLVSSEIDELIKKRPLKVEDIYFTTMGFSEFSRYYWFLWYRKENANLFEECRKLWRFCDNKGRATVKSYESKIRLIYGVHACSCLLTNILLPAQAYVRRLPPLEPNGTEQRVLPIRWFVSEEPYKLLGYHTTLAIQTFVVQNSIVIGLVCDATISGLVMLGAGFFAQLKDRLMDCYDDHLCVHYTEVLRCIKYHQRLMQYCRLVNNLAQTMLLIQVISSCYCISLILIKLISSDPEKYSHVPVIGICMGQLFLIQWTSDQLADASKDVAFAAYSVVIERLNDKKFCRLLHIMLARAHVPVRILAGGFIVLSLENYARMMNRAWSFFMVLRRLYTE